MEFIRWKKGEIKDLSPFFKTTEFECRCSSIGCVNQKIAKELVDHLTDIRQKVGRSIEITSGYRCYEHQLSLVNKGYETAVGQSQHELGTAADIYCLELEKLMLYAPLYFKAIGFSKRFLHVDLRDDKIRRWQYKN